MKPLLLTFDVEEFDWPTELGRPLDPAKQVQLTDEGLQHVLSLLAQHRVPATFFVTGHFAQARPDRIRAIAACGHEVGVHGLAHGDDYTAMAAATAVERLRTARAILAEMAGQPAAGVRTPRLQRCASTVLRAAGFQYDASPHPTWVPGRYNGLRWPRAPWWDGELLCVPISVLPVIRLPASWVWYRLLGPTLGGAAIRATAWHAPYVHLYFHPWEAVDVRAAGIPRPLAWRTGRPFLVGLEHLLRWGATKMRPMTISGFLASPASCTRATS